MKTTAKTLDATDATGEIDAVTALIAHFTTTTTEQQHCCRTTAKRSQPKRSDSIERTVRAATQCEPDAEQLAAFSGIPLATVSLSAY